MKKFLGVSIIAMMAVTPMFAHADKTIAPLALQNGGTVPESSQVATKSYVKGAYNSVANAVNAVVTDMTVASGTYNHINPAKSVAENLVLLDDAIDEAGGSISVDDGHYIGENTGHGSVTSSLSSLDTEVYDINTNKIGSETMGTTATTLTGAVKEMHGQTIEVATTWGSDAKEEIQLFAVETSDELDGD